VGLGLADGDGLAGAVAVGGADDPASPSSWSGVAPPPSPPRQISTPAQTSVVTTMTAPTTSSP
jgi:hypothetical protein